MKPIEFEEVNVRIAENQEGFITLPAYHNKEEGSLMFAFELSPKEREEVLDTGVLWIKQLTSNQDMQPIALSTKKDDLLW